MISSQAPAANPPEWLQEDFDHLATGILYYFNLTVALLIALLIVAIYFVRWRSAGSAKSLAGPVSRLLLAMTSIWSAVAVFAALTLSKEPRFNALTLNEWKVIGLVAAVVLLGVGIYEYYSEFRDL